MIMQQCDRAELSWASLIKSRYDVETIMIKDIDLGVMCGRNLTPRDGYIRYLVYVSVGDERYAHGVIPVFQAVFLEQITGRICRI
jgi:hypothetical protein